MVGGHPVVGVGHRQQVVAGVIREPGQPGGHVGDLGQAQVGGWISRVRAVLKLNRADRRTVSRDALNQFVSADGLIGKAKGAICRISNGG